MDRALIISGLQAVEERLEIGARQISKQRDLVSRLRHSREDATGAVALLHELQRAQEQHLGDRDRLRAELEVLSAAEAAKANTSNPRVKRRRRTPYGIR